MNYLIARIVLTRWGLRRWERDVNNASARGDLLVRWSVEKKGLRVVCVAEIKRGDGRG